MGVRSFAKYDIVGQFLFYSIARGYDAYQNYSQIFGFGGDVEILYLVPVIRTHTGRLGHPLVAGEPHVGSQEQDGQ